MLKAQELRNQSIEELKTLYSDLCAELFHLVNERRIKQSLEKPHLIKEKKKERARLLTILREKREQES